MRLVTFTLRAQTFTLPNPSLLHLLLLLYHNNFTTPTHSVLAQHLQNNTTSTRRISQHDHNDMSTPRPTEADWDMQQMLAWLKYMQQQAKEAHGADAAYIHPHPITYYDDIQKQQWLLEPFEQDSEFRDTVQKLEKSKKDGAKTWIAYCNTPNKSYVGISLTAAEKAVPNDDPERARQWHKPGRHAFVVVLTLPPSGGKHLYIFDSDQSLPSEPAGKAVKDFDCQAARIFVQKMTGSKMKLNIKRIFVGNRGEEYSGLNKCQDEATRFLAEVAGKSGAALEEDEDDRFGGFVEFSMAGGKSSD